MSSRVSKPAPRMLRDVLLLDADPARLQALESALTSLGLSVVGSDTADDATARSVEVKSLLIRRRVGDLDGFALVRTLRKKSETPLRILILGEQPNPEDTLRAIDVSALGILFEPVSTEVIAQRVRKALEIDLDDLVDSPDAPVFRIRRGGVVYKMRARPELLVDHLLQATEALSAGQGNEEPPKPPKLVAPPPPALTGDRSRPSVGGPPLPSEFNTGAFLVIRADRRVLFANPGAQDLLALPPDLSKARFEAPFDVNQVIERKINSGRRIFDAIIKARELSWEGQKALGVSLRDVTELRNLESQLRLSNQILDRVPAVVLILDPGGRIAYAGPGISTLLGYEAADALGEGFWTLAWSKPEDAQRMRAEFEKSSSDDPGEAMEAEFKARDGSIRVLAFQFAAGPGGTFIAVGQDVTALKNAQSESVRARELAEAATVAKSDFLANMSHEIRTPMNAVIGMTTLLLDTELTGEQRDYAHIIQKSGEALISLISDILDFSKIEAEKLDLERQSCSAEGLLEQCLDLLASRASEKSLDLAGFVDPSAGVAFWGDSTRIRQILVNLVANAVKFTETGGVMIEMSLQNEQGERENAPVWGDLTVSVADTGIGISTEMRDRLFKPFSQVDASTTRKFGGTGLGLAISNQLARMMGGRIDVQSDPGKGSRFTLTIPVEVISRVSEAHIAETATLLAGRRVLLCATGSMTASVIVRLVRRWGGASIRSSIAEAMDHLSKGEVFDLAVVDQSLAVDARGALVSEQALKQLKERCLAARVPVIALRPIASRNMATTQGISTASTMTPIKAPGLYQAIERALSGGVARRSSGPSKRTPSDPVPRSAYSVLVAEDNLVNQKVARLTLQSLGFHNVEVVGNGREVLRAMAERTYELLFLDLQMPEMGGLEATRAIRAENRSPRPFIIALTASAMAGDRETCMAAGMDDYVTKPLQRDALALVIERAKKVLGGSPAPEKPTTGARRSGGRKRNTSGTDLRASAPEAAPPEAFSPRPGVSSAIIDARAIERLRGLGLPSGVSGSDLVTELVDAFLNEMPDKLGRISRALSEQDYLKAHRFAHSVVSAAGNLGAVGVVKAARTLESVLRLKSKSESEQAYLALKREFDLAVPGLSQQRQKVD